MHARTHTPSIHRCVCIHVCAHTGSHKAVCGRRDVVLGSYDYLLCKAGDGKLEPQASIQDEVGAKYELAQRKRLSGSCPLLTAGQPFNPAGIGLALPKNSLYSNPLSRALQEAMQLGHMRALMDVYKLDADECVHDPPAGGDVIGVQEIAGLFVITMVLIACAVSVACPLARARVPSLVCVHACLITYHLLHG